MKKILGTAILLSVFGLVACGDGSSTTNTEDDRAHCDEHPELCEDISVPDEVPEE